MVLISGSLTSEQNKEKYDYVVFLSVVTITDNFTLFACKNKKDIIRIENKLCQLSFSNIFLLLE
jgi:hypothetical protein